MRRLNTRYPVPPFRPGPATGKGEHLSERAAHALARTIKAAWAAKGWEVDTRVERVFDNHGGTGAVAFAVRSDMVNGLPARRRLSR